MRAHPRPLFEQRRAQHFFEYQHRRKTVKRDAFADARPCAWLAFEDGLDDEKTIADVEVAVHITHAKQRAHAPSRCCHGRAGALRSEH